MIGVWLKYKIIEKCIDLFFDRVVMGVNPQPMVDNGFANYQFLPIGINNYILNVDEPTNFIGRFHFLC